MKRAMLGILVALAVGLSACGGGGDGKDQAEGSSSRDRDRDGKSTRTDEPDKPDAAGTDAGAEAGGDAPGDGAGDAAADPAASPEEQAYIDALLPSFANSDVPPEESSCIVKAYVDVLGLERLQQVISPEELANNPNANPMDLGIELTAEDGAALYDRMAACIDIRAKFLGDVTGSDQAVIDCLNQQIDDALLKRYVVALFVNDPEAVDPGLEEGIATAFNACVPS